VYRFYSREVRIGSETLSAVRHTLEEVLAVCSGTEKPTQLLRTVIATLRSGAVPAEWSHAYATVKTTIGKWVSDFKRRIEQLAAVVEDGISRTTSNGMWLGGLFAPEAYIMALRQAVASERQWSLEEVALEVRMNVDADSLGAFRDGCIVHGMTLEGAAWDSDAHELTLSNSIAHRLRNVTMQWVNTANLENRRRVPVPVYLNRNRSKLLFVVNVAAPLDDVPLSVWSQRGLALIAWTQST
jgi:dynein heavy chain 1